MIQITPFMRWLDAKVRDVGWSEVLRRANKEFTAGALQGWLRGSIPGPGNQASIAKALAVPFDTVKDLVWKSWQMKDEPVPRPTPGGRRSASLSPTPAARARRRKKLAAWLFAVASGVALGQPLPVESRSLITDGMQVRQSRGILSPNRRKLAA